MPEVVPVETEPMELPLEVDFNGDDQQEFEEEEAKEHDPTVLDVD